MGAPTSRSAELLDRIAATLGLPVEALRQARCDEAATQFAGMIADPDGLRLLAAFAALPAQSRAGLANVAEAIVALQPHAPLDGWRAAR